MNKTLNLSGISLWSGGVILAFVSIFVFSLTTRPVQAAITSELEFGSTGGEVRELQQFLATNSSIYPQGVVSGYFGPLTKAAVVQFQVTYNIPQVGRVGPMTQARINNIMSSGLGLDTRAPIMGNASVNTNHTGATINWTTNELSRGQVYYDTRPIRADEATRHAQLAYVSGTPALNNSNNRNSQSLNIQGLESNTTYYYLTRAIDSSGNVSMTVPTTFRTN